MKKIALISTFCDTEEKQNILKENIIKIKSLGIDVMAISPIEIPYDITKLCDFFFYTKENPILNWPVRAFTFWKNHHLVDGFVKMHHNVGDYGWAALYQVKKMSQIALSFDYEIFYHLIYDLEIDQTIIEEIKNNSVNLIHPRINPNNPDELWEATLHFMIFDREMMKEVVKKINLGEYLESNGVAEGQALRWSKELPISVSQVPIKDKVFYWKDKDLFDYSNSPLYKTFIGKNESTKVWKGDPPVEEDLDSKIRIFFYDWTSNEEITIIINGVEEKHSLSSNQIFTSPVDSQNPLNSLCVIDSSGSYDYTDVYSKVDRNLIYLENRIL